MPIKLIGATSGSIELDVPAAVSGGDVNLVIPGAGTIDRLERTGNILQVVTNTSNPSAVVTSAASYVDSGLTATITPTSTSSKVIVFSLTSWQLESPTGANGWGERILRNSTTVYSSPEIQAAPFQQYYSMSNVTAFTIIGTSNISVVDSPGSTSALTYKTQARPYTTASPLTLNRNLAVDTLGSTSTMILMEVAG